MLFGQRGQPAPVPVVQVAGANPAWDTTNRHCQETKCYLRNQDTSAQHTTTQTTFARETWVVLVIIFVTADSSYYFSIIDSFIPSQLYFNFVQNLIKKCIL